MKPARHPAEGGTPMPPCVITGDGHCHLEGVRYNPRPCADVCELDTRVTPPGATS